MRTLLFPKHVTSGAVDCECSICRMYRLMVIFNQRLPPSPDTMQGRLYNDDSVSTSRPAKEE